MLKNRASSIDECFVMLVHPNKELYQYIKCFVRVQYMKCAWNAECVMNFISLSLCDLSLNERGPHSFCMQNGLHFYWYAIQIVPINNQSIRTSFSILCVSADVIMLPICWYDIKCKWFQYFEGFCVEIYCVFNHLTLNIVCRCMQLPISFKPIVLTSNQSNWRQILYQSLGNNYFS